MVYTVKKVSGTETLLRSLGITILVNDYICNYTVCYNLFSCVFEVHFAYYYKFRVDPDSALAQDLLTLKKKENQDHILLHFLFKVRHPQRYILTPINLANSSILLLHLNITDAI